MPFNIACKACGTRLAVSDALWEKKIKGRSVKIACKNCGSDIRIDGTKSREQLEEESKAKPAPPPAEASASARAGAAPPADAPWAVSFADDDDRELVVDKIREALEKGEINGESLAWREGMPDWQPISRIPELAKLIPRAEEVPSKPDRAPQVPRTKSTTLAESPASKRAESVQDAGPEPKEPGLPAPPPPRPRPPTPSAPRVAAKPQEEGDVVSSAPAGDLAALAAPVPTAEEAPARAAGGGIMDAVVRPPRKSPGLAPSVTRAEPAPMTVLEADIEVMHATGLAGLAEKLGMDPDQARRITPLVVLGILIVVIVIVVTAAEKPPERISSDESGTEPSANQPVRDIREAMQKGKKGTAEGTVAAEGEAEARTAGEEPPVPLAAGEDESGTEDDSTGAEAASQEDDLVAAMKKAQEARRAEEKGEK